MKLSRKIGLPLLAILLTLMLMANGIGGCEADKNTGGGKSDDGSGSS